MRPREVRNVPEYSTKENTPLPNENFFYRPWMNDLQSMVMIDLLYRLKPKRCLEYGSGFSTCLFPKFIGDAPWFSVEHLDYFIWVIKDFVPKNVELHLKPPDISYISIGKELADKHGKFDFILVDGDYPLRNACIELAPSIMNPGGILMRHDAPPENIPVIFNGKDLREAFSEHGICHDFWWARL